MELSRAALLISMYKSYFFDTGWPGWGDHCTSEGWNLEVLHCKTCRPALRADVLMGARPPAGRRRMGQFDGKVTSSDSTHPEGRRRAPPRDPGPVQPTGQLPSVRLGYRRVRSLTVPDSASLRRDAA